MSYTSIIFEIIVLMMYIFIGYFARKKNIISETGIQDISQFIVNIAWPFLVFNAMMIQYEDEHAVNIGIMAVLALLFMSFTSIASKYIIKAMHEQDGQKKAMRYCLIFGNVAFLGYPLCNALFGRVGMLYASIYVVVQNLFTWTIGVNIYKKEKISLSSMKNLINPGIIAVMLGLVMFFLNLRPPAILQKAISGMGSTAIPLGLMLIGANLYGLHIKEILGDRNTQMISLLKVLLFPLLYLTFLYFTPVNAMLKSILTILASAPVQASAAVMAKNYKGDAEMASKCVFLSTLCCIITIPVFLFLINL
ncbi:AEC family transporter [Petroclostridium sp. X23]|uniref:AEC family transporter n=1 Tax=Petroclostridium sp. X23 TaxID=3045146 RepID=UPI0024AD85E0|nr:AEC family transporter [Petroclostridium sp. X23]WHH58190.1 AEC family transporter [Petroclostridium sp. X23]